MCPGDWSSVWTIHSDKPIPINGKITIIKNPCGSLNGELQDETGNKFVLVGRISEKTFAGHWYNSGDKRDKGTFMFVLGYENSSQILIGKWLGLLKGTVVSGDWALAHQP